MKKFFVPILFVVVSIFAFNLFSHVVHNPKSKNDSGQRSEEKEKKFDVERGQYFFRMLRDPATNQIPFNTRKTELDFAKRLSSAENFLRKSENAFQINWKEAGPNDVGGRTRAIGIDVNNSSVVLAGGVTGGMWKSTDSGSSWKLKTPIADVQSVTSIAQDTRTGFTNTWYYTSGEYDGSGMDQGYTAPFFGGGFYKSTDSGETWNLVPGTQTSATGWNSIFSFASRVVVSPKTGTVFIASNYGVIARSNDGGNNFSNVIGGKGDHNYTDVVVNSNGVLVAALSKTGYNSTPKYSPGIYKSTDDGLTWTNITPTSFPANHQRSVMAFSPSAPNIIYVFTNTGQTISNTRNEDIRLTRIDLSTGASQDLSSNLPSFSSGGMMDTQGGYDMAIAVHPTNPNLILIAGTNLFRSLEGFTSQPNNLQTNWIGGYNPTTFFYRNLHPDVHTIVFDPNNSNAVWIGHDGGLSYTSDITATVYAKDSFPWQNKNNGYNVTQFYNVSIAAPANDSRIMGGTQDNGTPFFTFDGTNTSASQDVTSGDGGYAYIGNSYTYGESQDGMVARMKNNSSGIPSYNSQIDIHPHGATGQLFINPFKVDPSNEQYMYYLGGNLLWRNNRLSTADSLTGWSSINLNLPQGYFYSTLAISQNNSSNVLYLGASSQNGYPKIYKLTNSTTATSATDVSPSSSLVSAGAYVHSIAVNPDNSNEILVVHSNYKVPTLFYSTDGGTTYTSVSGNLRDSQNNGPSIRSATILPTSQGTIYFVGTSTGVYSTTTLDGSNTKWNLEATNLIGNAIVESVTSRKSDGTIVAATHGRGAFVGKINGGTNVANQQSLSAQFTLYQNYPNPFNPETVISYQLSVAGKVSLKVFDALGREVATLVDEFQNPGFYNSQFSIRNSQLSTGIYFYRLTAGNFVQTKKMILLK